MMDALLPTFILLLTTGCCFGQDALLPASLNGVVGDTVTFTPSLEANLEAIIWQFTKGTEPEIIVFDSISNATAPGYEGRTHVNVSTGSLELRNLTLNDDGDYSVNLTVNGNIVHTGNSKLTMYEIITEADITGPTEALIAGNSTATLSCQAAAGTDISREWLKDGHPLSPSDRITFSVDNSSVSIVPVQGTDNGEYQCILTNPVGNVTTRYRLTVNFGPESVSISGEEAAEVNSKVELVCRASSVPPATYIWSIKGTEEITKGSNFTINKITLTDSGSYTCTASNNVTGLNSTAVHSLTVTEPAPEPSQSLSGGAIAGIVIGTIGGAGLIGGGGYFAYKKWYK